MRDSQDVIYTKLNLYALLTWVQALAVGDQHHFLQAFLSELQHLLKREENKNVSEQGPRCYGFT